MLVRLSRAPVLSGGLRRKTQLSPVPSTWPLPPRPHLTSPKILRSSKPAPSASVPRGAVRCVIIPKSENHQTQLHATQSWSATGLRVRKIKIKRIKLGQCPLSKVGLWSGHEKKKREIGMARKGPKIEKDH
ncbi:hypothetical protein TNCV_2291921 [Trichonephila clavipes]|uniref:Uncharacterized protein n=1 Tax=Trichonephila clavipes TaxID=2585209 RepID=A0A8X6RPD9_TRICX|nr:hypothetical protein TNCV_2291921 [Trichonephila clavipes]